MDNPAKTQVKFVITKKVRETISDAPITLAEIVSKTGLKAHQVSGSLCQLLKRNLVQRDQVSREGKIARKTVWAYRVKSSPPLP